MILKCQHDGFWLTDPLVEDFSIQDMEGGLSIKRTRIVGVVKDSPLPLEAKDILNLPVSGPYCYWFPGLRGA